MSVNGKGKPAEIVEKRPLPYFVRFTKVHLNGDETKELYSAPEIKFIQTDTRVGLTRVAFKSGKAVYVKESIGEAASRWGQREEVVRYEVMPRSNDIRSQGVVLRAFDITGMEISSEDCFTVLVRTEFGPVPVVGKLERVMEKASFCRPYAVFTKKSDVDTPLLVAIPLDTISNVQESWRDGATLIKSIDHIVAVKEGVGDVQEMIDCALDKFEADEAEALANASVKPIQFAA